MNFLMLWKGNKPNSRLELIKTVIDKARVDDTVTIYSDSKFIRNKKVNWESINTVESELIRDYLYFKNTLDGYGLARWSDILRMYLLSKKPDTLYLDTDIELYERPVFEDLDHPYFIKFNARYCDLSMMYNGNNTQFFKEFFDLLYPIIQRRPNKLHEYGFVFEYLNRWINKNITHTIDSNIYKHYELRGY